MPTLRSPLAESPYLRGMRVPFVAFVEEALPAATCRALVQRIDALSPAPAPITTARGAVLDPKTRNNERVMFDDAALAAELFALTRAFLPATFASPGDDPGALAGYNERFRGYRYRPGMRFAPHFDGAYFRPETAAGREGSELTALFYLNEGFGGGETRFLDYEVTIHPKRGSLLLFQHVMLHEGCAVTDGTKYVLRSDVMYRFPAAR
jgi:prolyl 4-hydroxylase